MTEPRISSAGVRLDGIVLRDDVEWEDDYDCRALVVMHPKGMSLEEISQVMRPQVRPESSAAPKAKRRRDRARARYRERRQTKGRDPNEPLSREAVRQIEAAALRKLERYPETREWLELVIFARSQRPQSMLPEDHGPDDGDAWPTYEDSRRLQQRGNKGAWGWDGETRPPPPNLPADPTSHTIHTAGE